VPDIAKTFLKKHSDRVPPGEQVVAGLVGAAGGTAWKQGVRIGAGGLVGAVAGAMSDKAEARKREELEATQGDTDAAAWPDGQQFWLILTDRHLRVYPSQIGTSNLGQGVAYGHERIAGFDFDKKMMISKLKVNFKDGTSVELDIGKVKVKPFLEEAEKRIN
jgi:hypothetical protein